MTGNDATIRGLVGTLVDDVKGLVRAEVSLVKATASERASALVRPIALVVVAILLLQAALTALLVGLGMALAPVHPGVGIVIAAVVTLLLAGLLVWLGARGFSQVTAPLPDMSGKPL